MEPMLNTVADYLVRQSCQISAIFLLVAAACWGLRKASAHWRYLLWLVVLAKCLVPALISVPLAVLPQQASSEPTAPRTTPTPAAADVSEIELAYEDSEPIAFPSMESPQDVAAVPGMHVAETASSEELASSISLRRRDWLTIAWILGVALFLAYISVRVSTTHRKLKRSRRVADWEIRMTVAALAERLDLKMVPTVYMVDGIAQPFVWGWLRGSIYLPQQFVTAGTREQHEAILTHELAHVARWDAMANLVQVIAQAVFFFHPLVWWTNRKIRLEREKCCDEIVLAGLGTRPARYCEAIVGALVTEYEANHSTPSLAVAGRMKNIEERIKTIMTPCKKFYRRPSRLALATVLLLAACATPTALVLTARGVSAEPPTENASQPGSETSPDAAAETQDDLASDGSGRWQPGPVLDFRVINARTKEPLPDVRLELRNAGKGIDGRDVKIQTTDAEGRSLIPLPDAQSTAVRVYPSKAGFVPLRVYWASDPAPQVMPKKVTVPMQPATTYGGVIRNEQGDPVPGVEVTVHYWQRLGDDPNLRVQIDEKTISDKDGRWQVDVMPDNIVEDWLRIFLVHPDYVSDELRRAMILVPITKRPSIKALREQNAEMVMRRGLTLEGRVVDEAGRPISGAFVYSEEYYWIDGARPAAKTTEDGRFQVRAVKPGNVILTVKAPGYASQLIEEDTNGSASPLEIRLKPGQALQGRVVDENGKPLEGVSVSAGHWRQHRYRLDLRTETDAEGKFRLADVPLGEVEYYFRKDGYMAVPALPLSAAQVEPVVTLKPALRVVGSIVDAETNQPLAKCSVFKGSDRGTQVDWERQFAKEVTDGRYEFEFRYDWVSQRIRVEADGYLPAFSRVFKPYDPDKGLVRYDFKLTKADPSTGAVFGLDGKPLADAEVYLETNAVVTDADFSINKMGRAATAVSLRNSRMVKTDAAGHFELPAEVEPFNVHVLHDQGYAIIPRKRFAKSSDISIRPWPTENRNESDGPRNDTWRQFGRPR